MSRSYFESFHVQETQESEKTKFSFNRFQCLGSLTGQVSSGDEMEKLIDAISVQDVTNLANKVVKGKPAIAAVGHLDNMPYVEDLAN